MRSLSRMFYVMFLFVLVPECYAQEIVLSPGQRLEMSINLPDTEVETTIPVITTVQQPAVPVVQQPMAAPTKVEPKQVAQVKEGNFFDSLPTTPYTKFDMYVNAGHYEPANDDQPNRGDFFSVKLRYRPFQLGPDSWRANIGLFALGEIGAGKVSPNSKYDWNKWLVGPTAKKFGNGWDISLDLGMGKLNSKTPSTKQDDTIVYTSANLNLEQRRKAGKRLFPQTEFYGQVTSSVSGKKTSNTGQNLVKDKKDTSDLIATQWIYDVKVGKTSAITPGALVGIGSEGKMTIRYGGAVKYSAKGEDIVTVSAWQKQVTGSEKDKNYVMVSVNVSGLWRALTK